MRTLRKVTIEPVFVERIPYASDMEQDKFYISEKYAGASHLCLCGCGLEVYTGLKHEEFPSHWRLVKENNGTVSLIGSIGNYNFPCKSHYIITKNVANFV